MKIRFLPLVAGCALLTGAAAPAQNPAVPSPSPSAAATEDLSQFKTADAFWKHLETLEDPNPPPTGKDEIVSLLHQLSTATAEFQARFPDDPRRWEAKMQGVQFNSALSGFEGRPPDRAKTESELNGIAQAADAPDKIKAEARLTLLQLHGVDPLTPATEKEIEAFLHDFPQDPRDAQLQEIRLKSLQKSDAAQADAVLNQLLHDPNPNVAKMAQAQVGLRDLKKKPLDLKFTALDGSEVDVSKLRGKVVLIDFWATWCGPCMGEVPNVVKAYNDLHDKGFEIVGISLDQDKEKVESVTKSKGMVWPQYFDGKGWQNEISSRYDIESIPTMWLLDEKGMLVDTEGREGLEDKVTKLLAP